MTDQDAGELSNVGLSVIVRPRDHRPTEILDTLLSLAAQDSDEFEIVVEIDSWTRAPEYRELISAFDPVFTRRVRLVSVNHESDETPLTTLVLACRGRYITRIDVPDVVFGNWSTLFSEGINSDGGVLYGVVAEQPFATVPSGTGDAYVSVGRPSCPRPLSFDVLAHFETGNESPGLLGVAIPRKVFTEDVELSSVPDELLEPAAVLLAALHYDVVDLGAVTYLRRRLATTPSDGPPASRTAWDRTRRTLLDQVHCKTLTVPSQIFGRLQELDDRVAELLADLEAANDLRENLEGNLTAAAHQIEGMEASHSWRITKPLRDLSRVVRTQLQRR
ncbi:MAG: hypothetical protein ACLP62_05120 [Acidimicrobiales bacterium]